MNWIQIVSAIVTLIGGSLFYLLGRIPGSTYFIPADFNSLVLTDEFGLINQALPSLIHPIAFILLTVGILGCRTRKGILFVCLFWLLMDGMFELLQHDTINQLLMPWLPAWFDNIIILDNFKTYMEVGRFDLNDLIFMAIGVVTAFFISLITRKEENPHEHTQQQTE